MLSFSLLSVRTEFWFCLVIEVEPTQVCMHEISVFPSFLQVQPAILLQSFKETRFQRASKRKATDLRHFYGKAIITIWHFTHL